MLSLSDFEPWWQFGFALLSGALIGLEREFYQQKEGTPDFAGIRTFSLIALLGAVTSFLVADFGITLAAVALGGLVLLTAVSYRQTLLRQTTESGITTEIAAILTFLFGVLIMSDHALVGGALAVVTSLLLALKGRLHGFIRNMTAEDIHVTLQFALVAAVILPLLPNRPIGPLGLINPFQIWLMVVLVSGIGFFGYVLMKIWGPSQGTSMMGILGGLASSTATTISFSTASREHPEMAGDYARGVILASTVMLPRMMFLILVVYAPLARLTAVPLAAMLVTGLVFIWIMQRRDSAGQDAIQPEFEITNPLKLGTAIKFGLLFALVLVAVDIAQLYLGSSGVYLASVLAGLTDVNAITLSVAGLTANAQLAVEVAATAVIIAAIMNTFAKGVIAHFSGSAELRRIVNRAFFMMILAGVIAAVAVLYLR